MECVNDYQELEKKMHVKGLDWTEGIGFDARLKIPTVWVRIPGIRANPRRLETQAAGFIYIYSHAHRKIIVYRYKNTYATCKLDEGGERSCEFAGKRVLPGGSYKGIEK